MVGIPLIPVIKEKENTQAIRIIWRGKKDIKIERRYGKLMFLPILFCILLEESTIYIL